MKKHPGVRPSGGNIVLPPEGVPRYEDQGIDKAASRWQTIATLPEARVEEYLEACQGDGAAQPTPALDQAEASLSGDLRALEVGTPWDHRARATARDPYAGGGWQKPRENRGTISSADT